MEILESEVEKYVTNVIDLYEIVIKIMIQKNMLKHFDTVKYLSERDLGIREGKVYVINMIDFYEKVIRMIEERGTVGFYLFRFLQKHLTWHRITGY